jgi:hypothetical protein
VAGTEGGALFYDCEASDFDMRKSNNVPCKLNLRENFFESNSAPVGGAIRWNFVEMISPDDATLTGTDGPKEYNTN